MAYKYLYDPNNNNLIYTTLPLTVLYINKLIQRAIHESPTGRQFSCHSNQIHWVITKASDMHYLLIAIYPPVKFEICSFNTI